MKNILILCTGNSCRSQIAHGFLNHFTDNSFSIYSAGIEKHGLNKNAVKSMADIGIDISHHNSNLIDEYKDEIRVNHIELLYNPSTFILKTILSQDLVTNLITITKFKPKFYN